MRQIMDYMKVSVKADSSDLEMQLLSSAESTWLDTAREDKSLPDSY